MVRCLSAHTFWSVLFLQAYFLSTARAMSIPPMSDRCTLALQGGKSAVDLAGRSTEQINPNSGPDRTVGHQENNIWDIDGAGALKRYQDLTRDLLVTNGHSADYASYMETGHALDLMGSGIFAFEAGLPAERIVGLRLGPMGAEFQNQSHKVNEVYGDILSLEGWATLDRYMNQNGIKGFSFIVLHPFRGLEEALSVTENEGIVNALRFIVQNGMQRLNSSGSFFFSITEYDMDESIVDHIGIKNLKDSIDSKTDFELFLKINTYNSYRQTFLTGAIIPKNER